MMSAIRQLPFTRERVRRHERRARSCLYDKNVDRWINCIKSVLVLPLRCACCPCIVEVPMRTVSTLRVEARARAAACERVARPGYRPPPVGFDDRRVLTLESRRAPELALLIVNYGGRPVVAPALREVPLDASDAVERFADDLIARTYDFIVLMTGVGTRLLLKIAAPTHGMAFIVRALAGTRIVARGPKPAAALREAGIEPWLTAPSPNTWKEVVATLDRHDVSACRNATVAIQEYGSTNHELIEALEDRGAKVRSVPVYRWELPDEIEPLRSAVRQIINRTIDVVLLTAGVQLLHLLQVASGMNLELDLRAAFDEVTIASIGPMTSDEVRRQGLRIGIEASHPKMGFLVKEAAEHCRRLCPARSSP
jgi:uroporphyrinogen-III synthase